ncbi:hypothetical protein C0L75_03155 [Clostridium perfringens]
MEKNNQDYKKTMNKLFAVGVLKKKEIVFGETSTKKAVAQGKITLLINKKDGKIGEVVFKVQQYRENIDGTENPNYKALKTIDETYKSVETNPNDPDTVRIEGRLEDNIFFSTRDNKLVENLDLKAFYLTRVAPTEEHFCKVGFEGYISKVEPISGGALNVEIIGIANKGIAFPLTGEIPVELSAAFQNRYKVGCTTTLNFNIDNEVQVEILQSEVGFGQGLGEKIEKHITKRTIFGGGAVIYQGSNGCITEEEIQKAIALREVEKSNAKDYAMSKSNGSNLQNGFGETTTPQSGFGAGVTNNAGTGFGAGFGTGAIQTQDGFAGAFNASGNSFPSFNTTN